MEDINLNLCKVLSDPTRFNIYNTFLSKKASLTVAGIAEQFSLHPNVARMHLTKLEEARLIVSNFRHLPKRGRPERSYQLSDKAMQISLPFRNFQLLAKLLLEILETDEENFLQKAEATGERFGQELVLLGKKGKPSRTSLSLDEVGKTLLRILSPFDSELEVLSSNNRLIEIQNRNCLFQEVAEKSPPLVCSLHRGIFRGILDTLLESPQYHWREVKTLILGDDLCLIQVSAPAQNLP